MTINLDALTKDEKKYVLARSYPLFSAYYFGFEVADFHAALDDHENAHKRVLELVPAGHGKTTQKSKIKVIQRICLNPNIRMILTMKTAEDASAYCKSIENELVDNKKLVEDFGPFYNKENWTSTSFRVSGCQHNDPHDTLEVFGTGSWKQLGHRCDVVICDDVVTEDTSATPDARRKQLDWFRMAVQTGPQPMWPIDKRYGLMVPEGIDWPRDAPYNPTPGDETYGQVIVVGTRFHPKDLYYELENDSSYDFIRFDCWTDKEETKPLWPRRWTNDKLHQERESLKTINFNKRYRNIAMDESEILFKREFFDGGDESPGCLNRARSFGELPKDDEGNELDLFKALGFDPASGEVSKWAAYPTFDLVGFPRKGDTGTDKRYLIDAYRQQVGPEGLIDIMFDGGKDHYGFYKRYQYDECRVERNGFANLLIGHHRVTEAKHRGVIVVPHLTGRNKTDPVSGVKSMEAIFRDGLVDIPYKTDRDKKLADEIIDQFIYFSFDRTGRKRSLTDYVMAFWLAELSIRGARREFKAKIHPSSRYTVQNPLRRNR